MLALVVIGSVILITIFGQLLTPYDPNKVDLANALLPPSSSYWLGTDDLGRDLLSRLLVGTRFSVWAGVQATLLAVLIGVPLGVAAGYLGRTSELVVMRSTDIVMTFPPLILAIAIVAILEPGIGTVMIAIGIVFAPRLIRLSRASTLAVREELYVRSSQAMGAGRWHVMTRHIAPNIVSPILVDVIIILALSIVAEASLSFLGLGVQPPLSSWGTLLGRGFRYMSDAPMGVVAPGLIIVLVVGSLNAVADRFRASIAGGDSPSDEA